MKRAYEIGYDLKADEIQQVFGVLEAYRKTCTTIAKSEWVNFFKGGKFNKLCDVKSLQSSLSERYKRNAAYQVNATLQSFLGGVQNKFKDIVLHSKLGYETQKHLFQINRRELWLKKEDKNFTAAELFLAHKIFKRVLKWWRKPDFSRQNMVLNANVAKIIPEPFCIKLSTTEKGKPLNLPLKTNEYFDSKVGKLCQSVQINKTKKGRLKICLVKEIAPKKIEFTTDKIAMDIGFKNAFALNNGNLYGRNFFERLKKYDHIIVNLQSNLQRQGLKPNSSKRYRLLVYRIKEWLKNELRRIINRIFRQHKPKEIIIESLDFRNQNLSKKLNRIISNFGKGIIEEKLKNLSEEYGIKVTKINAAYTSQTCDSCGYVSKNNRPTQAKFACKCCHKKTHADVVAARNHFARAADKEIGVNTSVEGVLSKLVIRFEERIPRPCSWANGLLAKNPYFTKHGSFAKPKQFP